MHYGYTYTPAIGYNTDQRLEQFTCKADAYGYAFACEWLIGRTALTGSARIEPATAARILERYNERLIG